MVVYYYDTCGKMRDIFTKHCNLSMEQYEEISGRLIDLVAEIPEFDGEGTYAEAERKANELGVIFEFLMNTKEITLEEYNDLCNMVGEIAGEAEKLNGDGWGVH
jgi:hypothetical protein